MSFQDTPVGAGKEYLVKCGGIPMAGFDTYEQARRYVAMQYKAESFPKREATYCCQQTYTINGEAVNKPSFSGVSHAGKGKGK